jgi:hypothetical protein
MNKIIIISLCLAVFACTENPFGGKKKIVNRTITGRVVLDRVESYPNGFHDGVFIWSEGLGLQATTDIDGTFELVLPASSEQSSGAIVDGDYTIHFFLGNYLISNISVSFAAGQIVNDSKLINIQGEISRDISLTRILGVHTSISPGIITSGFDSEVEVIIELTPDRPPIFMNIRKVVTQRDEIYTGLLFKDEKTNNLMYSLDIDTASTMREFIAGPTKDIVINFDYVNVNLPTGNYEVIPYFMIDRKDIPQGILSALGAGYNTFSEKFFNLPIYRTGGKLVVQ